MNLPIQIEIGGQPAVAAVAADMSLGGFLIKGQSAPAFGTEVTIHADLPGAPGARLPATVRWASPAGFGVQFGLMGARETHALIQLAQLRS